MSPFFYYIAHIVGIIILFAGYGSLLDSNGSSRNGMKFHGIGFLIVLIAGFGLIAKLKFPYSSPWIIGKFAILLILGFLPMLAKRRVLKPSAIVWIAILLGGVAAYLAYMKPGAIVAP
jgi:hypothetical protein